MVGSMLPVKTTKDLIPPNKSVLEVIRIKTRNGKIPKTTPFSTSSVIRYIVFPMFFHPYYVILTLRVCKSKNTLPEGVMIRSQKLKTAQKLLIGLEIQIKSHTCALIRVIICVVKSYPGNYLV